MARIYHQNKFGTNVSSNQMAGVTTTPLNSIPTVSAPFYIALDATNVNSHYEVVPVTSKTSTNINHAATTYAHTTAEEVRMVVPAEEMDDISESLFGTTGLASGWVSVSDTWAYASADAPTFTITVPAGAASIYGVGMRIKLTQTTVKYFIITAVADTVLTVYGGTDYTLANAAISAISYSTQKAPLGFPLDPTKWTVETVDASASSANVTNAWSNLFSQQLTIPIGVWKVEFALSTFLEQNLTGGTQGNISACLSTTTTTMSNSKLSGSYNIQPSATGAIRFGARINASDVVVLAAKTVYNVNYIDETNTVGALYRNSISSVPSYYRAICAYL